MNATELSALSARIHAQQSSPEATTSEAAAEEPDARQGKQELALAALVGGATVTEAALRAGVDRRTITRWKRETRFQAELHQRQRALLAKLRSGVCGLADLSVKVIQARLDRGHVGTAVELLTRLQVLDGRPLSEVDEVHVATTPEPAAPLTRLPTHEPPCETNSTDDGYLEPTPLEPSSIAENCAPPNDDAQPAPELCDLPIRQQVAITALLTGLHLAGVAQISSVSEFTIRRWLYSDATFRSVLRVCREEQAESYQARLLSMGWQAVRVMLDAINRKRNYRVAFAVLRGTGVLK